MNMEPEEELSDIGVIVGRFQTPYLTDAHRDMMHTVLGKTGRLLIIVGVAHTRVTMNNPLSYESRRQMIFNEFPTTTIAYIKDVPDNDELWSRNLDSIINDFRGPNHSVMLYGGRDSFIGRYHGGFNTRKFLEKPCQSATQLRKETGLRELPTAHFRAGVTWAAQNRFATSYQTVDIAVLKDEELLIGRKENEIKWRFPGGFVDPQKDDSLEAACKREVNEETCAEIDDLRYVCSLRINDGRYSREEDKIMTAFYTAKYIFGDIQPRDDLDELKWVRFLPSGNTDILPGDLIPSHEDLLRELIHHCREKGISKEEFTV